MPEDAPATETKLKCFFISPIGAEGSEQRSLSDKVLKHIVRKGLGEGFQVERGDEPENPGAITPQIVSSILTADLIVADLTGSNANVFYELAVAHGYRKPCVHLLQKSARREFDVKDMRTVPYDLDPDEIELAQTTLAKYANFAIANPDQVETPLTGAAEFSDIRTSKDPVAESNVLVLDAMKHLSRDVRRALERLPGRVPSSSSREHTKSLRTFVERVVARGAAESNDFDSLITPRTSSGFDRWITEQFSRVTDGTEDPRDVLWNQEMFEGQIDDQDEDEDR